MRDRDADLSNSYDPRITGRFSNGLTPEGQTVVVTNPATGKSFLRPYHYPGLPVLILPGYALAGACGAKMVVLLLTAIGLTGLFALLRNIGGECRRGGARRSLSRLHLAVHHVRTATLSRRWPPAPAWSGAWSC